MGFFNGAYTVSGDYSVSETGKDGPGLRDGTYTGAASVWGSPNTTDGWIYADLGAAYNDVIIEVTERTDWGASYTNARVIEYSTNASTWYNWGTMSGHVGAPKEYDLTGVTARYVRLRYQDGSPNWLGVGDFKLAYGGDDFGGGGGGGGGGSFNSPYHHWKLDEAVASADAIDAVGNANLIATGSMQTTAGKINQARSFDGTVGNRLLLTPSPIGGATGNWSISSWVYFNSPLSGGRGAVAIDGVQLLHYLNNQTLYLYYTGSSRHTMTITGDTWYHLVVTRNGTSGDNNYYVNGANQTTANWGNCTDGNFRLGEYLGNSLPHNGAVDEVTIWNDYELTTADVTNLYNGGAGMTYEQITGGGAGGMSSSRLSQCVSAIL